MGEEAVRGAAPVTEFRLGSHELAVDTLNARPRARESCSGGDFIVNSGAAEDREGWHRKV
jgi:hypothetical protein